MKVQISRNRRGELSARISLSRRNIVYLLERLDGVEEGEPRITSPTAYPETVITAEEDDIHYEGIVNDDLEDDEDEEIRDDDEEDEEYVPIEEDRRIELPPLDWRPMPPNVDAQRTADMYTQFGLARAYTHTIGRPFGVNAVPEAVHDEIVIHVEEADV